MALNVEIGNANQNVKRGSDDGSYCRNRECDSDDSESQNWKSDEDGSENWYWEVIMMALNVERRCDDGSERRNRERNSERQTRKWWWLWSPKPRMRQWLLWKSKLKNTTLSVNLGSGDGSEHRNRGYDSEHQTDDRWWLWTPKLRQWLWTLTKKWWWWLWTSNWKHDDGSEYRNWKNDSGSECRKTENATLNA